MGTIGTQDSGRQPWPRLPAGLTVDVLHRKVKLLGDFFPPTDHMDYILFGREDFLEHFPIERLDGRAGIFELEPYPDAPKVARLSD